MSRPYADPPTRLAVQVRQMIVAPSRPPTRPAASPPPRLELGRPSPSPTGRPPASTMRRRPAWGLPLHRQTTLSMPCSARMSRRASRSTPHRAAVGAGLLPLGVAATVERSWVFGDCRPAEWKRWRAPMWQLLVHAGPGQSVANHGPRLASTAAAVSTRAQPEHQLRVRGPPPPPARRSGLDLGCMSARNSAPICRSGSSQLARHTSVDSFVRASKSLKRPE